MFIFCKQNISKAWPIYAQYFQTGSLASTQVTNQEFLMLQTRNNFWTSDKQIVKRWYQAIHMYSLTLSESNLQLCWTCCIQIQFSCFMLFTEKKKTVHCQRSWKQLFEPKMFMKKNLHSFWLKNFWKKFWNI